MVKTLARDYCIIQYRNLPLQYYWEKIEQDFYWHPHVDRYYWIEHPDYNKDNKRKTKKLIKNFVHLYENLEFEKLIFLGQINKPWISKYTSKRKDYKALLEALSYFKSNKIGRKFNGGVEVSKDSWKEFLKHFFVITRCDGGFFDYYFTDENQNILFHLHYSGNLKALPLNAIYDDKFKKIAKELAFENAFILDADLI